jgi:hypothetical protein
MVETSSTERATYATDRSDHISEATGACARTARSASLNRLVSFLLDLRLLLLPLRGE